MTGPGESARASALILAAGGGTRMGGPKALLEFEGQLLVERAIETALAGGCEQAVVILGAQADEIQRRAKLAPAHIVVNPDWAEGMSSSLRTGLAALAALPSVPPPDSVAKVTTTSTPDTPTRSTTPTDIDAALILLVDQPFIGPPAVRAVLDAWRSGARLASAAYAGKRGHPVLFGREHWPEAARSAIGDSGARALLAAHAADLVLVPCDALADPRDLDTPEDLER